MKRNRLGPVVLALVVGLLPGCGRPPIETESESKAVKVEPIEGTDLNRVTVTAEAAERLDIQMAPVRSIALSGKTRKAIPYASLVYDVSGNTWAYTSPESLTFVRMAVTVDYIEGDLAILTSGPPAGTQVVTVGVAELYGSENEFEEE